MTLMSIRLTEKQEDDVEKLVEMGIYLNKNEAIRDAVRELLERKLYSMELKKAVKEDLDWARRVGKSRSS